MPLLFSNSRIRLPLGQLFWREIGRSPTTLVFLHGSSRDSSQWIPLLERLGENYHCLAVDLLGFGDSERVDRHYSVQLLVESFASYLEALRLERVYLVGHSLGGWVATHYALQHPERVRGLILISPSGVSVQGDAKHQAWEKLLVSRFSWLTVLLRSLRPLAKFGGWKPKIDRVLAHRQELLQCPTTCDLLLRRSQREIEAEYLDPRLERLKVPTLILQGNDGNPSDRFRSQVYAKLIPNAQLRLLADTGDDLLALKCDRAAVEIREFLATEGKQKFKN
ncbi:alpha/beta hydrolase [Oscillatoria sp. FACHB-1406]|uniref:alpha/beta fold hydrolase n=1 Tax=Oscillatoria sp. FACHB-1406 TaxID=2692846 RepID=UPI00168929E7|nr:alpha/beta hydrolase [Oscillatoria sp. FACHB-1406]MBD2580509.1 alpha/beta hydrolase [Oscillatoria sp. FACHB-1406]